MAVLGQNKHIRHWKCRINYSHHIQSVRHLSIAPYCPSLDRNRQKDKSPTLTLHALRAVSRQVWGLQGVSAEWQGSCREGWRHLHGPSMQLHSQQHLEACGHSTGEQIWLSVLTYWPRDRWVQATPKVKPLIYPGPQSCRPFLWQALLEKTI